MPSKSASQARLMAAVAHNPAFAKKVGIAQSVGKDFNQADKGRKFKEGGTMKQNLFKGKESYSEELKEAKAIKAGKMSPAQYARGEKKEEAVEDKPAKYARGGGIESRGKTQGKVIKMAAGGFVRKADGIAQRGKTQAKQITMKRGGKC